MTGASERTSRWPIVYVPILGCSGPVSKVGGEGAALGHGARDDGGGGGGEDELEEPAGPLAFQAFAGKIGVTDEGVGLAAVSESVTEEPIRKSADDRVQQVLDQDVGRVFTTDRAAF